PAIFGGFTTTAAKRALLTCSSISPSVDSGQVVTASTTERSPSRSRSIGCGFTKSPRRRRRSNLGTRLFGAWIEQPADRLRQTHHARLAHHWLRQRAGDGYHHTQRHALARRCVQLRTESKALH